ncbi:hypothetical protein OsJ_01708 [Oryza sativa Japonica Group]|uniref:DUF7769 domain-containing protein n=1 Tax=Oryza sativa subsp. japonica TaxID=39947 RepID=A2ZSY5_ORYSJ|nr:hypothetical protein OsJ_01708 [Oryza sativa Japonica Group]
MEHDLHVNAHVYEEQQQVEDGDDALQLELEALENYLQDYGVYADAVNVVFDVEELPNSHEVQHANGNERSQSRDLTNIERRAIYARLLEKSMNGKLEKDTTSIVPTAPTSTSPSSTCINSSPTSTSPSSTCLLCLDVQFCHPPLGCGPSDQASCDHQS